MVEEELEFEGVFSIENKFKGKVKKVEDDKNEFVLRLFEGDAVEALLKKGGRLYIVLQNKSKTPPVPPSPSPPPDCTKCGHNKHEGRCAVMDDGIHPCECINDPPKTPPGMPEECPITSDKTVKIGFRSGYKLEVPLNKLPPEAGRLFCDNFPKTVGKKPANSCVGCTIPGCREKGKYAPDIDPNQGNHLPLEPDEKTCDNCAGQGSDCEGCSNGSDWQKRE